MIARVPPSTKPIITVANPDAEPTDAWICAIAVMLLADVDRERDQHPPKEKPREGNARNRAGQSSEWKHKENGNTDTRNVQDKPFA